MARHPAPTPAWRRPARRAARRLHLAWALLAALGSAGCAVVQVDGEGRRHVVGLVWMTLPPADARPTGAETLRVRSLGLGWLSGPIGQSAVLGYSDHSLSAVRNDSVVRLTESPGGAPR